VWRKRCYERDARLTATLGEVAELKLKSRLDRFRAEWCHLLLSEAGSDTAQLGLLARYLPQQDEALLWLIQRDAQGGAAQIIVGIGPAEWLQRTTVSSQLWDQLEIQSGFWMDRQALLSKRWLRLPDRLINQFPMVLAVRCGDDVPVRRLLLTTHVPQWSINAEDNLQLLSWACRIWTSAPVLKRPAPGPADEETRLVRIMLELRTIADMEFASPLEMIRDFLRILGKATGFQRVALYLAAAEPTAGMERFCWAGGELPGAEQELWQEHEERLIRQHQQAADLVLLLPEQLLTADSPGPLTSATIGPLISGTNPVGLICLSSRTAVIPTQVDQQIISWAARFLLQTLSRTVDRVVVEEQARRDFLTKLANRHTFDHELERQLRIAASLHEPCSLILVDLDHFKQINDKHGHPAGDAVLREVSRRIESTVGHMRVTDRPLVARLGGEELAVLLPGVPLSGAARIAEEIRLAIRTEPVDFEQALLPVTASLGLAVAPQHGSTANELLAMADAALYSAKAHGRDCVRQAVGRENTDLSHTLSKNVTDLPLPVSETESVTRAP
jgi:diguanylate cyclase (GGDEF)-like protein